MPNLQWVEVSSVCLLILTPSLLFILLHQKVCQPSSQGQLQAGNDFYCNCHLEKDKKWLQLTCMPQWSQRVSRIQMARFCIKPWKLSHWFKACSFLSSIPAVNAFFFFFFGMPRLKCVVILWLDLKMWSDMSEDYFWVCEAETQYNLQPMVMWWGAGAGRPTPLRFE